MPKVVFQGAEIEVQTLAEAAELVRMLTDAATPQAEPARQSIRKPVARQPKAKSSANSSFPDWAPQAALSFLTTIRDAGQSGAHTDAMMKSLGITAPKALGGRSAIINRVIEDIGYAQTQVYDNKRTAAGRIWKPRKHLQDAIKALQDHLAAAD